MLAFSFPMAYSLPFASQPASQPLLAASQPASQPARLSESMKHIKVNQSVCRRASPAAASSSSGTTASQSFCRKCCSLASSPFSAAMGMATWRVSSCTTRFRSWRRRHQVLLQCALWLRACIDRGGAIQAVANPATQAVGDHDIAAIR